MKFIKTIIKKEFLTLLSTIIIIGLIFSPICTSTLIKIGKKQDFKSKDQINNYEEDRGTEYWALIVAVGVYYNHPNQDRPSMLEAADNLYNSLLDSPNWQAENIHVLKGSQATATNVIRELIWLIKSADEDDMSLVYITTHGAPLYNHMDLPPKDEADGVDECLIMYYGFEDYNDKIVDDTLSFFFRFLKSEGLCVIIDSCYSGGFDDPININNLKIKQTQTFTEKYSNFDLIKYNSLNKVNEIKKVNNDLNEKNSKVKEFTNEFTKDFAAPGRIVLMSCTEEEVSYG